MLVPLRLMIGDRYVWDYVSVERCWMALPCLVGRSTFKQRSNSMLPRSHLMIMRSRVLEED